MNTMQIIIHKNGIEVIIGDEHYVFSARTKFYRFLDQHLHFPTRPRKAKSAQ